MQEPDVDALIRTLESQRAALGDAAVDFAVAALRARQATAPPAPPRLRQLSILFCDIAGSTALLQRLQADDAPALLGTALQDFARTVEGAGGKVLRFTGDGLKAVFGADAAREDDAERAVRAGLAIIENARAHAGRVQAELGVAGFGVRVGINTGPVVLGGGVEADNTAMGHAVNIAARMEQSAPIGTLRISHGTWVHVRGLFHTEAQPPLIVKGSDEPLLTHLVRGTLTPAFRAANRGIDGVATPMLGRDAELAALLDSFDAVARTGRLHAATVLAEAGVGKSRLLHEFRAALDQRGAPHALLLARARPASVLQPYGLLRQMLATHLRIADDDTADTARRRLVEGLAPWLGERGELQAQSIGRLIGLDFAGGSPADELTGRALREHAFRALRRVLEGLAAHADAPTLLLFDDLHWADDGSLDFVQQLVEIPLPAPLLVVSLARPGLLERRPGWLEAAGEHRRLTPAPLDAAYGEALAAALLQRLPDAPAALRELLVERAAGNPFYMEELVRMLLDDGAIAVEPDGRWRLAAGRLQQLKVPDTLFGVLQARLDTLPEADRLALQQASIVGPVFWGDALAAIDTAAPAALPGLRRRALVQPHAVSAFEGTDEHAFQHQLLHDVAYGTVLKPMRRHGHAAAARWLAARVAERSGEFLAVAAEHFERAGDSAQALEHYDRAARDAAHRYANSAAQAYLERALAQPALTDPKRRFALLDRCWQLTDLRGRPQAERAALDAMADWAERCDDDAMRAQVLSARMLQANRGGDPPAAAALARRCIDMAERADQPDAASLAHAELAWLAVTDLRFAEADAHLARAREAAQRAAERPELARVARARLRQLRTIGIDSLTNQNRLLEAATELERALDPSHGASRLDRCLLQQRRGWITQRLGDLDAAQQAYEAQLVLATDIDAWRLQCAALHDLALMAQYRRDAGEQQRLAVRAGEIARDAGLAGDGADALLLEGAARLDAGDTAAALAQLQEAAAQFLAQARPGRAAEALARQAEARRRGGDLPGALADAGAVLAGPPPLAELDTETLLDAWRVLDAGDDRRAPAVLELLHGRLLDTLAPLAESALRERIVRNLPHWREVAAAWRTRHPGAADTSRLGG